MSRLSALIWALVFAALPAAAVDAATHRIVQTINGRTVTFTPPRGMCALNPEHAADKQRLDVVRELNKPTNQLIAMFAECSELDRFREQPALGLDNFEIILIPSSLIGKDNIFEREAFLREMKGQFETRETFVSDDIVEQIRERISEIGSEVKLGQAINYGLLASSAESLIIGIVMVVETADEGPVQIAGAVAFTTLNGVPVSMNLYHSPYQDESTMTDLVVRVQRHTKTLVEANGDVESRPVAVGRTGGRASWRGESLARVSASSSGSHSP